MHRYRAQGEGIPLFLREDLKTSFFLSAGKVNSCQVQAIFSAFPFEKRNEMYKTFIGKIFVYTNVTPMTDTKYRSRNFFEITN